MCVCEGIVCERQQEGGEEGKGDGFEDMPALPDGLAEAGAPVVGDDGAGGVVDDALLKVAELLAFFILLDSGDEEGLEFRVVGLDVAGDGVDGGAAAGGEF